MEENAARDYLRERLRDPAPVRARRWRALLSSGQIRLVGAAGFGNESRYRHFGMEFWSSHPSKRESAVEAAMLEEFTGVVAALHFGAVGPVVADHTRWDSLLLAARLRVGAHEGFACPAVLGADGSVRAEARAADPDVRFLWLEAWTQHEAPASLEDLRKVVEYADFVDAAGSRPKRAEAILDELLYCARHQSDAINDAAHGGANAEPPTGDDYNQLLAYVEAAGAQLEALRARAAAP